MKPTVGSLFAGIGGFDLGFERAGFETVWQVEIDEYCRRVLERHFPRAERFGDIRECGARNLKPVDVICGGFPCQDISFAGLGAGIDGERSGLWGEYFRIICQLRPSFAVVENVSALLDRGMGRVLGDLASIGYDAEWDCLPACAMGAPQMRERVFTLAYPAAQSGRQRHLLETGGIGRPQKQPPGILGLGVAPNRIFAETWPSTEPSIPLLVDGFPSAMDELGALGNAVVPQIAQWIAERIKAVMEA